MFSARTLAWRTACCALGAVSLPGSSDVRSGTAAASPAAQACSLPSTASWAVQTSRPRAFSGRSLAARTGWGLTPAVQTRVRFGKRAPSLSTAIRWSQLVQAGFEAYVDVALAQFPDRVRTHLVADFREDAARGLHEDPVHVVAVDVVVGAGGVPGHVLQLREGFDARVPAADEDEGEGGVSDGRVAGRGGDVQLLDDVVAQADGLFDALEADAVAVEAGDREGARHGARGQHEFVVLDLDRAGAVLGAREGGDGRGALGVTDGGGLADDDAAPVEHPSEGDDDMPGREGSGGCFGEERLIRHIGVGRDHGDLRLAGLQLPLEVQRGVQTDIAAADDENARAGPGAGGRPPGNGSSHCPMRLRSIDFVHRPGKLCDWRTPARRSGRFLLANGRAAGQRVGREGGAGAE